MQINNFANEQMNKADSDSKVSALEAKLTPKMLYNGNVDVTSGVGWIAVALLSNTKVMLASAQCVSMTAPCEVSWDNVNAGVFVCLPTAPTFTGTIQVKIFGIGWE